MVNNTFTRGLLVNRLLDANLDKLEPQQQREIGLAVARRGMQGTFVVWGDGIEDCAKSDSIKDWPVGYREGVFQGLYTDKFGNLHANPSSILASLRVIDPIPDIEELVKETVEACKASVPLHPERPWDDPVTSQRLDAAFQQQIEHRSAEEAEQLWQLKATLGLPPF